MAITLDSLKSKLDGLKAQLQQLQNNANAVAGAIQLVEQLIKEEEAVEVAPSTPEVKE
jgi:prefoldin subunit 5